MTRPIPPAIKARLTSDGKIPKAGLTKPVPLSYQGRTVGRVERDGTVSLSGRQGSWYGYVEASDVEKSMAWHGVRKVFGTDGEIIAVVVPKR